MKETSLEKLLKRVSNILNELSIEYFITGGFAVSVWGRPRSTFDIDIVVNMVGVDIDELVANLREISEDSYVDEEMADRAVKNKGEFNFIDPETGVKVDFFVMGDSDWSKKQNERKILKNISGTDIYFISPEDLILNKLRWHKSSNSEKHLGDAKSVMEISKERIDLNYLRLWVERLDISDVSSGLKL